MSQHATGAEHVVVPPHPAALAMTVGVVRKLAHDLNNAMLSLNALCELAELDAPACADVVAPIRAHLDRPHRTLQLPQRTLPTRSALRPRDIDDWRTQLHGHAQDLGIQAHIPQDLPTPVLPTADWVQCLDNVTTNTLDAVREVQSRLTGPWHLIIRPLDAHHWQGLEITDNAGGCTDLAAVAAGERKRTGPGHLGLGLQVAAAHLARVGGQVAVRDATPAGMSVLLRWPAASENAR